ARRRLALGLLRLVQVFAKKPHSLVVFLDDMQWADTASLQLLTQLATAAGTEALLVIEAYRDNEVDPAHPFALAHRGGAARSRPDRRADRRRVRPAARAGRRRGVADLAQDGGQPVLPPPV